MKSLRLNRLLPSCLLLILTHTSFAVSYQSQYSSLKEADCQLQQFIEEGESTESSCPSFAKINVQLVAGDLRESLVMSRAGKDYPMEYWTSGFSKLGDLIEWRYLTNHPQQPLGFIVRLTVNDQPDKPDKTRSYLLVNKITDQDICLVGKVLPQKNQNKKARRLLEQSARMPCLAPE